MKKHQSTDKQAKIQAALQSYCQVCFVPFNRVVPRKLDEGEEICECIHCHCRVHKGCYDLEMNSSFVNNKFREFVCQRCQKKELGEKACIICHKKQGALKQIGINQVIHVFCGLMHNQIISTGYYPDITFKKSENYKQVRNACGLCSKPNATEQCAMQSCFKRYHGYCIWLNYKIKEQQQEDPQCEKYYFSCGDNGNFDLSGEVMQRPWVYEEFDRVLTSFEEFGYIVEAKEKIKERVYDQYCQDQKEEKKNQVALKRGGFAYILCKDHESSMYCNCLNRGNGDMVQCQCCFQWYHQKCVSYQPTKANQNYVCIYCNSFYDLKKKMIQEVKGSKTEGYELKFEPPKLHLNDYIWILRVIDHRIAGGGAAKMMKELAKYPLKSSKMELVVRNQNKKKLSNLTQSFIQKYLSSEQHEKMLKPKPVLKLDQQNKPVTISENIEENKKLRKYVEFIQSFVRKNNLPDSFAPVIQELKFKERAIQDNYETILELSKYPQGYPQIPILKIKVEEYSFLEVIKDIDSGSNIRFEDLENAVQKAKGSSNVPSYLLKPLIQRYEKVKNLVQLVSKNINQKKESSSQTQNAVKKLKQEKVLPPQAYLNFHNEKKFINELYLLYLKQEGKPLDDEIQPGDKIQILLREPACKPNREIADCVNSFNIGAGHVFENMNHVVNKYFKICIVYQLRQCLKKKTIRLGLLDSLSLKYQQLGITDADTDVASIVSTWIKIRKQWIEVKNQTQSSLAQFDDITQLTTSLKRIQEVLENIKNIPLQIVNKAQQVPYIGSINRLYQLKSYVETLTILFTEAQLRKNPMTVTKLPEGLPRDNPLVKQYNYLKREQTDLLNRYYSIYTRINEKIQSLKSDSKKPRNEQIKQNSEKPKMTDVHNFIDTLRESKVNMDAQVKELTKSVNKSIQISSKVNKFIAEEKHLESLFKEDDIDAVKKQIDDLRKKVLVEAEISLENELKELYHAEICVRMQKMVITSNAELDKMNKLLKFAEEEGLNHISTYRRLKSKFEVGNQSTKEINLTRKHQQFLNSQAQKLSSSDTFYSSLVFARKSLPLSIPQTLKQKNKHYEQLLSRNDFLRAKIDLILSQQPKKYQIEEAKSYYLEALKHPFEIQGLNKLINEFEKLDKVLSIWKQEKQIESSRSEVFTKYEDLIFHIEEIEALRKSILQCEQITNNIKKMKQSALNLESLWKVEENLQSLEASSISKNSKIYTKFKIEYYGFWVSLLQKFREEKQQTVPFSKLKSILLDVYTTIQKNTKNNEELKSIVYFLEDIMLNIRSQCQVKGADVDTVFQGFVDLEELKYQISSGLDVKDQIKILNPFNDLSKFYMIDLQRTHSRNSEQNNTLRRQRTQTEMEDPYLKQTKFQRSHKGLMNPGSKSKQQQQSGEQAEQWQKDEGGIVSQAQRAKAKEVIIKNIRKNQQLSNYQNLEEQVRMIENQLFGENHNQIFKYFELVNSLQKLFIKLISCPNISAKVAKKKFEWKFLMLLISNINQIGDIQNMVVQKPKDTHEPKQMQRKESKQTKQKQKEAKKQAEQKKDKEKQKQKQKQGMKQKQKELTIEEMIASGKIDESVRRQMKKEIKAIREKNKKKKHKSSRKKSRSRSRSQSRSPNAKFSSDSEENQLPAFIQKEYIEAPQKVVPNQYIPSRQPVGAPLLFDPQLMQDENEVPKKSYPRGTVFQLKNVEIELNMKKRGKVVFKAQMMTNEDYEKIISELVDPNFMQIQLRRDKPDQEIIQYLNKPSRKKYKFLVGWFEADSKQDNELIRDFAIQCNQRGKIFGVQNDQIKMHVMTIQQYTKIIQMHEPPRFVTSENAAEALKDDRIIYVLQYPSDKMYELKGIYQSFNNAVEKEQVFQVMLPNLDISTPMGPGFVPGYMMGYNPLIVPQQAVKVPESNLLKPVQYEGWSSSQTAVQSFAVTPGFQSQTYNPLNNLSRFSPIMTDQDEQENNQNNENEIQQKAVKDDIEIDLASNILNSIADVNIKPSQIPPMPRNFAIEQRPMEEQRQRYQPAYRYQSMPQPHIMTGVPGRSWQPQHQHQGHVGMMPQHGQMGMSRMSMPYNPMSMVPKYAPQGPPSVMYKNPMMPVAPPPAYGYQPGNVPQQKAPGSQPPYDPYMYQRQ